MHELIEGLTEYCVDRKIDTKEFVDFLNQSQEAFGKESQEEISKLLDKFKDEQRKFLILAFIAVVDGTKYEGKDLSEDLMIRVRGLNQYIDDHKELFTTGRVKITGPERELIVVKRIGETKVLDSYFNPTRGAIGLEKQVDIGQNYLVGQLLSNGFVIKVKK
ncbi:hypothetical protein [Lactobacillus sp. PV012]|uniref:hypothetical protein n=1 Tax=Lactobacillus sp. PV012 TaxID=2594494 RepID=UPI0022401377|nr:hypothetical protein [Lactobacillus sp. PV012]QNQ82831.1 hypothetical protein FP433_07190 [Lactobacillus sp. PV012]